MVDIGPDPMEQPDQHRSANPSIEGESKNDQQSGATTQATGAEPELGGILRHAENRSGLEPELGGIVRQKGVYVDEVTCIGCKHCAHVARNTFFIEPEYGRSRVIRQDGDPEDIVQEAIDTCPVDCIHWVDYTELKQLEAERRYQVMPTPGFPIDSALVSAMRRRRKERDRSR